MCVTSCCSVMIIEQTHAGPEQDGDGSDESVIVRFFDMCGSLWCFVRGAPPRANGVNPGSFSCVMGPRGREPPSVTDDFTSHHQGKRLVSHGFEFKLKSLLEQCELLLRLVFVGLVRYIGYCNLVTVKHAILCYLQHRFRKRSPSSIS